MSRSRWIRSIGLGVVAVGVVVVVVVAIAQDVTWNLPLLLLLVLAAVLPAARSYGSHRARLLGRRLRERR